MTSKSITGLILLFLVTLCAAPVFAASLKLKTGETIEGKLVEKTNSHVKIDVSGVILTYFYDDIETTSWEKPDALKSNETTASQTRTEENLPVIEYYVNEKAGVLAWHPKDWIVYDKTTNSSIFRDLTPLESKDKSFNYVCAFSPSTDKNNIDPLVMIIIQHIPKNLKDASAEELAELLKDGLKKPRQTIKIIELPYVIEIDGKKIVKQIFLRTSAKEKQKIIKYSFIKGYKMYTLSCSADAKIFEANKKIFEKIAANLKAN
jgi:hypothetical protein